MNFCYLFDIDLIERHTYPTFPKIPNHALMKFSSYYKQKGYTVKLVHDVNLIPLNYNENNLYIGSALYSGNLERFKKRLKSRVKFKNSLKLEHIKIGTPLDYCPVTDLDHLRCDYTEYEEMLRTTDKKLEWYPTNVGFLTRGCYRHCKYCVNRNKNKITRVNTLEDIYVHKGKDIELLDDNLFSSDEAVQLLEEIAIFAKREHVEFHLRNGLDLRSAPDDKIKALQKASFAFKRLHCAWDTTRNTFILRNLKKIIKNVKGVSFVCYMIAGVNIHTEEELRKDLLGLFYRYFMLRKVGAEPYIALYEDDTEQYKNPYWNLYKTVKRQYAFQKQSRLQYLKRQLPLKQIKLADKTIELLGEYSWLVELNTGQVLKLRDFNTRFKKIAEELNIRHYDV